jgi:hypothetical protein
MVLHDDADLPLDAGPVLEAAFRDPGTGMACFRLALDQRHWLLGTYAWGYVRAPTSAGSTAA